MSRQTHAVYTVSLRQLFSEVRLAILDPCRQVCNANFTFLGLLTGRWHTLRCSGALGHVWSECRLAKLVNLCTVYYTRHGDRAPQSAAQEFPSFSAVCVQVHAQICSWDS